MILNSPYFVQVLLVKIVLGMEKKKKKYQKNIRERGGREIHLTRKKLQLCIIHES